MEPIKCAVCGTEFVPKSRRVLCCSKRCGHALGRRRMGPEGIAAAGRAISAGKKGRTHRGASHTEETKRVIGEKTAARMRDPLRNPFVGKRRSEESRERQSRTRAARFVDGTYQWKTWVEAGHVESKKAGRVFCRSSWEKRAVQLLDDDPTVAGFEVEPFAVPYYRQEGEGQHLRHYVPDFLVNYVDGRRVVVEVKPECHVDADVNVAKFAAARELCARDGMLFEVWTQRELGP